MYVNDRGPRKNMFTSFARYSNKQNNLPSLKMIIKMFIHLLYYDYEYFDLRPI